MKYNILIVLSMVILSLSSCEKKVNGLTANCVKGDATSITIQFGMYQRNLAKWLKKILAKLLKLILTIMVM